LERFARWARKTWAEALQRRADERERREEEGRGGENESENENERGGV
jgi:hypothetical protein